MNNFYITKGLFACGASTIALYLPLYFLHEQLPLWLIFLFFAVNSFTHAFMVRTVTKATSHFGIVPILGGGIFLYILFYLIIRITNLHLITMVLLAILYGLSNVFYWIGYHLFLATHRSTGKHIGYIKNISSIASAIGPALGAIVVIHYGFPLLFILAASIMMVSIIPLIREKVVPLPYVPSYKEIFNNRSIGEVAGLSVGFGSENNAQDTVWPLYIIVMGFMSIGGIGITYSFVFLGMILITYMTGWTTDNHRNATLIFGAFGMSILNMLRAIGIVTPASSTLFTFTTEAVSSTANISVDAICYERAHKEVTGNISTYILFREIVINAGSAIFFMFGVITQNFLLLFFIAGIGSLCYMLFLLPRRLSTTFVNGLTR